MSGQGSSSTAPVGVVPQAGFVRVGDVVPVETVLTFTTPDYAAMRRELLAEAKAWREIAEHLIAQTWGCLPGPFTTSSAMRERGLLAPHLFSAIRRRAEEWSAPEVGLRTLEDEWALVCLLIACEVEDEAHALTPKRPAPKKQQLKVSSQRPLQSSKKRGGK